MTDLNSYTLEINTKGCFDCGGCLALTRKGKKCRRQKTKDKYYCYQHLAITQRVWGKIEEIHNIATLIYLYFLMTSKKVKRMLFNTIMHRVLVNKKSKKLQSEPFINSTKVRVCKAIDSMSEIKSMMCRSENVNCYHETKGEINTCLTCLLHKNYVHRALYRHLCSDVMSIIHEYTGALCLDKHRSYLSPSKSLSETC